MIRKATLKDVRQIHALLQHYGRQGELLPRPLSALYDHLRDFTVYMEDGEEITGCCALQICWEDMAEIRSLAVWPELRSKGAGSALLLHALKEARELGIRKVFALTYRPGFFARHGFGETAKESLPQKIWADCLNCVKFPDCDEVAMLREVEE
jgi:amino-acid N-acetyltransferase